MLIFGVQRTDLEVLGNLLGKINDLNFIKLYILIFFSFFNGDEGTKDDVF